MTIFFKRSLTINERTCKPETEMLHCDTDTQQPEVVARGPHCIATDKINYYAKLPMQFVSDGHLLSKIA